MTAFRLILISWLLVVSVYTVFVIAEHGFGLYGVFFGDIAAMGWPGQFNLDFLGFLFLSGTWVVWRHHYSPTGWVLGLIAFTGGIPFLSVYLLVAIHQTKGDIKAIMLGSQRAKV